MEFVKAHGTGNDFVVVEDLSDHYQLTPELVRAVCDRHFGIGADGLLVAAVPEADGATPLKLLGSFFYDGTSGLVAGGLLFAALGVVLARAAQKKLQ